MRVKEELKSKNYRSNALRHYKTNAKQAAADFGYGDRVISKIRKAKSMEEISIIMTKARKEKFG